jgi:hypothetical protein
MRLADSGSGYNAQSVMPLHFGLGNASVVDVEVTVPQGGRRITATLRGLNVRDLESRTLMLRRLSDGRLEREVR